eukprot:CAMPEP_0206313668 /NCGR_PEP_ID=MMETSP0106_2-20121207/14619_1 /ASSEMBLY_ACC=CAM_ASM_000206 /TAXON_ID=81532 /ORGANISM="Acanthoeca-like sp., Strain 10tr" /LENGTH=62 /DNA_ID=CAMNT_0053744997 /DNA_START=375 /DNA_END=560 /DNA_ORIENTATION=+
MIITLSQPSFWPSTDVPLATASIAAPRAITNAIPAVWLEFAPSRTTSLTSATGTILLVVDKS